MENGDYRNDQMKRLVYKHDVIVALTENIDEPIDFVGALKNVPVVDAVEVVRCKDCKHHEELLNNNYGNVLCWVHGLDVIVDRNGYCNYGEREEQEHE